MEGRRNPGDGRRFQREIVIVVAVDGGTSGGARSIEAPAPALYKINPLPVRPCPGARAPPRNRRNGRNESSGGPAEARNKG